MRVKLIGNLTTDIIHVCNNEGQYDSIDTKHSIRFGGLMNVSRTLDKLKLEHCIQSTIGDGLFSTMLENKIDTTRIKIINGAEISIVSVICGKKKESYFSMGVDCIVNEHYPIEEEGFDWYHFAYLDRLYNNGPRHPYKIPKINGIVSVDLCTKLGISSVLGQLDSINYLIISDREAAHWELQSLAHELKKSEQSGIIVHSSDSVTLYKPDNYLRYSFNVKNTYHCVGAGDAFVAGFISCQDIQEAARIATEYYNEETI